MEPGAETQALWDESIALHAQGRYDEALERLRRLETLVPGNPRLLANAGMVYRDNNDLAHAEDYLRRACALLPDDAAIHFNLALTLMRAGRLREGFREYEWRWKVKQFAEQNRRFEQPLWQGDALNGRRILLHGEQGAGAAMQFVRYAPLVRAAGGEVIVEVLPHLERLMGWMEGGYRIVNALNVSALKQETGFDVHCPLMSLPERFGTELDSIPAPARFAVPDGLRDKWSGRVRPGPMNVGLAWAGNPRHPNDRDRSFAPGLLAPWTRLPGIRWWSLQASPGTAETPEGIANLAPELIDFGETAAAITALDLVITVDTAVAHLAGSLGKPVWLLAAYTSDWRWLLERTDTPWYGSMRIFRQRRPREWSEVVERVGIELRGELAGEGR